LDRVKSIAITQPPGIEGNGAARDRAAAEP